MKNVTFPSPIGVFFGYMETFMYRYLILLGGSKVLVGLTVTVGAPFEFIVTILTSYIVGKVGHAPIIMLGLLAQAVRLFGKSSSDALCFCSPMQFWQPLSLIFRYKHGTQCKYFSSFSITNVYV